MFTAALAGLLAAVTVTSASPSIAGAAPSKLPASTRRAELAYVLEGNAAGNGVYIAHGDGTKERALATGKDVHESPSWAPDGSRVAFDSNRDGDGDFDIWVVGADGQGLTNLTPTPGSDAGPVWSPQGDLIAFTSNRDGNFDLYVMRPDGTDVRNLTNGTEPASIPQWSPDGKTIVFSVTAVGNAQESEVWAVAPDGTGLHPLTASPGPDYFPTYSPDGRHIAFVSQRDRAPRIFQMDPDGSHQEAMSPPDLAASFPSWSPNSRELAFTGQRSPDQPADVFVVRTSGGRIRNVSRTVDNAERLSAWSPDGKSIAATSAANGQESIFVFRASDGTGLTIIGNGATRATFPVWKPRPRRP